MVVLMDRKKVFALVVSSIIIIAALAYLFRGAEVRAKHEPTIDLSAEYMVLVDAPENEEDMMFIAALSSLVVHGGYNPMFILENGSLDDHQLWTIQHMNIYDVPKLLFTNSDEVAASVQSQVENVEVFERNKDVLLDFKGFDGTISVGSYEEAMWVAPLANIENKMITIGDPTFEYQEEVWAELVARGVDANYVIVTNPEDYRTDIFYSEGIVYNKDTGVEETFNTTFHIPGLSAVAAEMAAYHRAFVLTDWIPSTENIGEMDPEQNSKAIGLFLKLREIHAEYGPIEYICLVGSAEAVPQFKLPDETSSDPSSVEGDKIVECDVIYGYLDEDIYVMDAAVGRIVNKNIQGVSNQISRTFGYDYIVEETEVSYSMSGSQTVNWKNHASVWNGFEVADQRLQMTPGMYATDDFQDEGFTAEYMRTTGNEGVWGSVQDPGSATETFKETELQPIVESSSIMTYRGHGSWHATFYVWEPEEATDPQGKSRLEGNDQSHPDSVCDYFLPPQVFVSVCCENAKIQGAHWWGGTLDMEMLWVTNYFYAGGVGLVAATEVSFSNLGQDIYAIIGVITGNPQWDLNNAWYAFTLDGLINHEDEYGTIGKAHQWAENRYIKYHDNQYSAFDRGSSAHWKEIAMYVCYGDPAFQPYQSSPGGNNVDPWHNGPDDR
jgi:hypothetical protein